MASKFEILFIFCFVICLKKLCVILFILKWVFFCVGVITLTNIYMIEQCNKLFTVKLNPIDYYILKRFSARKRPPMKSLRYVNSKVNVNCNILLLLLLIFLIFVFILYASFY